MFILSRLRGGRNHTQWAGGFACPDESGSIEFARLPLRPSHIARIASLPLPPNHRDLFDRLLVAQTLIENLPLVSSDIALDANGIQQYWRSNR
jgi:PIN domain nuclease of toxin-antitoxin system